MWGFCSLISSNKGHKYQAVEVKPSVSQTPLDLGLAHGAGRCKEIPEVDNMEAAAVGEHCDVGFTWDKYSTSERLKGTFLHTPY